jgi:outer membrane protein assembly factor BamD (BamD/ComL family)
MGREPNRPRQYFYFCVALLICVTSCSVLQDINDQQQMREALARGKNLLAQGDFDQALTMFQKVLLTARDQPPADVAAYNIALVYAHPRNPHGDLYRALGAFNRMIQTYPDSPLVDQAKVWVEVLTDTEESRREVERAKRDLEKSKDEMEKTRVAIEKSKQEVDRSRAELEKTRQEIEKTKEVIEKSKQVDMEIDEKRRVRGR